MQYLFIIFCWWSVEGVIRHGIDKNRSLELAAEDNYQSVGKLMQDQECKGSCVLIHPQMVITAAHNLAPGRSDSLWVYWDHHKARVTSWIVHPSYSGYPKIDLAILILDAPIRAIKPAKLYKKKNEIGRQGISVGYGHFSVANNPRDIVPAGQVKSAGQNIIDSVSGIPMPNGEYPHLFADFDHPENPMFNKTGSSQACELEFGLDGGDSGGGLFIHQKRKLFLAGISAFQNKNIAEIIRSKSFYGSSSEWVRISVCRKWIQQEIKKIKVGYVKK
jgi:hypothetical protein